VHEKYAAGDGTGHVSPPFGSRFVFPNDLGPLWEVGTVLRRAGTSMPDQARGAPARTAVGGL